MNDNLRQKLTREFLSNEINKGKTASQIAQENGYKTRVVYYHLERLNINKPSETKRKELLRKISGYKEPKSVISAPAPAPAIKVPSGKKDYVLDLLLRDIAVNMDVQINALKAQNSELRVFCNNFKDEDKWEQYFNMNHKTAASRLHDNSCIEEYDRIAAEG